MKKFIIPNTYRSSLLSAIKEKRRLEDKLKKDFTPTLLDFGTVHLYLARHFGFCYGVENAIEIAFRTLEENPEKRIFLLSEMIHNPKVNKDLTDKGILFLQDTYGKQLIPFSDIEKDDIVLIPAFGTTLEIEKMLLQKGITTEKYNTTCPFVEKVWNRSQQLAAKGYSVVIHGKPQHEETRATFSHTGAYTASIVINNMEEAIILGKYITGILPADTFHTTFRGRYSENFDSTKDLQRIGVVNQTTQLASDTQAISDYLKNVLIQHYHLDEANIHERFADTRDTLCYATNDNQSAVLGMLQTPADLAIVVGGYNSSNTSHLVELCEKVLPTYFINDADNILSDGSVRHADWRSKVEDITHSFIPIHNPTKILLTSGASCPDAVVENVIEKLAFVLNTPVSMEAMKASFS
jgi:4-hydroxy-3-methylbut-2-enyl diphosphate reductase